MRTSTRHHELTEGVGKCSVPMWMGGLPAGFCDRPAFGNRKRHMIFKDAWTGERFADDGGYVGHVPGLCCEMHGGPACPGIEIEPGVFSGCRPLPNGEKDCPVCA
jgi:hypothetical protein